MKIGGKKCLLNEELSHIKIYEHLESYNKSTKSYVYLRNLFNKECKKDENKRISED